SEHKTTIAFYGYQRDTYNLRVDLPRFGTGAAQATRKQTVRGYDIYIVADVFNYGCTYKMYGMEVPMSPDDHFSDIKRVISAISGKARRITVIMPMLYEGRQHKRNARESLDCSMALQELTELGVESIVTFDAHDQRVQNAIPHKSFENVQPAYQMIKALVNKIDNLKIDKENLAVISPDEGGMHRCIYFATVLGVDLGMFYKRRDYTVIENGRNKIVAHEYLGDSVKGKDLLIVDDMISSGESMLEVATKLKELGARRIFIFSTFGLFCNGLDAFDQAYEQGLFEQVFTTNSIYATPELLERDWYTSVDVSKYISYIIDTLNHDMSVSNLLNSSNKIKALLKKHNLK
ncbi:MAG: ribose-phosphate pyrophosphokinase, partial [Clostridiales bacterium]|nr:ribose-phosphate pyrophosphokinase [Clostridiales bacterium]